MVLRKWNELFRTGHTKPFSTLRIFREFFAIRLSRISFWVSQREYRMCWTKRKHSLVTIIEEIKEISESILTIWINDYSISKEIILVSHFNPERACESATGSATESATSTDYKNYSFNFELICLVGWRFNLKNSWERTDDILWIWWTFKHAFFPTNQFKFLRNGIWIPSLLNSSQ